MSEPVCWPYPEAPHFCGAHALPLVGDRCRLGQPVEPEPLEGPRTSADPGAAVAIARPSTSVGASARRADDQIEDAEVAHGTLVERECYACGRRISTWTLERLQELQDRHVCPHRSGIEHEARRWRLPR